MGGRVLFVIQGGYDGGKYASSSSHDSARGEGNVHS
jgi:hypothetical protein